MPMPIATAIRTKMTITIRAIAQPARVEQEQQP
jgi:hypothetical protein